ncbi:fimbrial adhesin [Escherichia coli]|nr:fimbrial adhesin [Escherichia coli]
MGKTISIKVLFGIYLLLMAGKVFAFSCNVDGGSSIGAGTTSVYVNLDPVIQPGQNLVVDLSQHISGFAPIFPDICYHLTHYKPAAADIPVASDNPAHYADAIRYNARTPLQGSLLPLTRLVWA